VLTDDMHEVIVLSNVHIADDPLNTNQRAIVTPIPNASDDGESESKIVMSTDVKDPVFTLLITIGITYLCEQEIDGSVHCGKNC
jgi:hypothetical protein